MQHSIVLFMVNKSMIPSVLMAGQFAVIQIFRCKIIGEIAIVTSELKGKLAGVLLSGVTIGTSQPDTSPKHVAFIYNWIYHL